MKLNLCFKFIIKRDPNAYVRPLQPSYPLVKKKKKKKKIEYPIFLHQRAYEIIEIPNIIQRVNFTTSIFLTIKKTHVSPANIKTNV